MGKGVKGCNCIICQADRDGTGDIIGTAAVGMVLLFVIFLVVMFIAFSIFG